MNRKDAKDTKEDTKKRYIILQWEGSKNKEELGWLHSTG
jgi:hypothetical protein